MLKKSDTDINSIIPKTYGIGIKFCHCGGDFVTCYEGDTPRKVVLDITSWIGMTAGALHYYGTLKIESLKQRNLKSGSVSYLCASAPKESTGLQIQLTRPLTKKDMLIDGGERFRGVKTGERIRNFDSKEDVKLAAVQFFKKHFSSGWMLVMILPVNEMSVFGKTVVNKEAVLCD